MPSENWPKSLPSFAFSSSLFEAFLSVSQESVQQTMTITVSDIRFSLAHYKISKEIYGNSF